MSLMYNGNPSGEFYNFDEALKNQNQVKSLFLNYTFLDIEPITPKIGKLINLERLQIVHKIGNNVGVKMNQTSEPVDPKSISPIDLPDEISECINLKYLDVSGTDIENIPKSIFKLNNLETLHLSGSKIKLDDFIDDLLTMKSLKELFIVECQIEENNLKHLRQSSKFRIYESESDLIEYSSTLKPADVQIHDSYYAFPDSEFAYRFANSFPFADRVKPIVIEK